MELFFEKAVAAIGNDKVKKNIPLKDMTTFNIGGAADVVVEISSAEDLRSILMLCKEMNVPYYVLGNGSNILASDEGYRGVIIHILKMLDDIKIEDETIYAMAGASLIKVARQAANASLTGLEFASGIPGSIGGAIYMNAGAYGGEMKDVVKSVTAMTKDGEILELGLDDLDFGYRHSAVQENDYVVLSVELSLKKGNQTEINDKISQLSEQRRSKQPLEYPSAGSTFKRPEGYFAGKLIMDAGLRGFTVGGAQVAEKHCGFVINKGGATAKDVMDLINQVQDKVKEQFGVTLETEVKTLGEF